MSKPKKNLENENTVALCKQPHAIERKIPIDVDPRRASLIRSISDTWVNGTEIHYCFWDSNSHDCPKIWDGTEKDKTVVRNAFKEWKDIGIGLKFIEVFDPSSAEVRIGFEHGQEGSWSYIGTYVLQIPMNRRTMNFGWPLSQNAYGRTTAIHEIGHTLGMPHEHQNPNAGLVWNEQKVYDYFSGPPNNWKPNDIYHNILRKIPANEVKGSAWDPKSIMHYSFNPELINGPQPYSIQGIPTNYDLSIRDKEFVQKFYPIIEDDKYIKLLPFKSHHATLDHGEQVDFIIEPVTSRKYTMQTFGNVDTLLVLFEHNKNENLYLSADDDGGYQINSKISYRLHQGRKYILRLRFYYGNESGNTAIMIW